MRRRPAIADASVRLRLKSSPTIEIAGITAANDRLRVAEPRAWPARAFLKESRHEHRS
jgi:hypothetical protein